MTDSVGLGLREDSPPQERIERKRPGLAWLLGSLYPGLGAAYVGKWPRAAYTGVAFSMAALYFVMTIGAGQVDNPWLDATFRFSVFLYVFSFLDAFYTAREINSGVDAVAGDINPRVAAILNFLTNGLGYFYAGARRLGIVVFFVLWLGYQLVNTAAKGLPNTILLFVLFGDLALRTVLALDAYGRSLKQRRERLSGTPLVALPGAPSQHLEVSALGPLSVAGLITLAYLLLHVLGLTAPEFFQGR